MRPAPFPDIPGRSPGSGDAYIMNPALKDRIAKSYHAIDIGYTPEIVAQLAANNAHASIRYYAIPDGLFYPWLTGQKIEFRDES